MGSPPRRFVSVSPPTRATPPHRSGAGVLRHRGRFQQVVQRRRWYQRRKIIFDKWDAKLFNVGQAFTNACQNDFMLVGNGNAFDSAGVKPRSSASSATSSSYTVSPEAANVDDAGGSRPSNPTQYPYGPLRLLLDAYRRPRPASASVPARSRR